VPGKKQYEVRVLPDAADKMEAHIEFLARISEPAAERLRKTLKSDMNNLKENPERFKSYKPQFETSVELHYLLSAKRYRIVYGIVEGMVFIFDIQDCRQDTDKNLV
jgi:plasmid stabilization system protein ParE